MPVATTFAAFRDAVRAARPAVVDVAFEPDAELLARRALTESGMLLLGECHGVAENAAIITALVERLEIDTVALEWPAELRQLLDRFVRDGELVDDRLLWLGDGRITAEHFAAFKALAQAGVAIVLIDRGLALPRSWSERDRELADATLARTASAERTLVIAGNAHTPVVETRLGTPMGASLARARPGTREIVIQYGSGTSFNVGPKVFPDRFGAEPTACLCVIDGELRLRLPRASAATVAFTDTPGLR